MRWLLTSWEILSPCHYQSQKMQYRILQYWNFHSRTLELQWWGQIWLAVTPQGLWGVNDGLFSPEQRGKGFHDLDIQSTTWTINTEVLGLLYRRSFTKQHLMSPRSFPGFILLLAYHCQVDYILTFLYLNPILMFYCCSYNVNTHTAHTTKLRTLYILTKCMIM